MCVGGMDTKSFHILLCHILLYSMAIEDGADTECLFVCLSCCVVWL